MYIEDPRHKLETNVGSYVASSHLFQNSMNDHYVQKVTRDKEHELVTHFVHSTNNIEQYGTMFGALDGWFHQG